MSMTARRSVRCWSRLRARLRRLLAMGRTIGTMSTLLGPAVENSNVVAVGPAERGEVLAEGIEKALVLLPRPRLDKADARDLGRGRFPGYCRDASEQQEIAAFHLFTSSAREIAGSRCDLLCELVGSIALTGALDRGRGRRPGRY